VEQALHPDLKSAGTSISNPESGKAEEYLEKLEKHTCYLQHLSEGIDDTARGWFLRLQINDHQYKTWGVTGSLAKFAILLEDALIPG